MRKRFDEPSGIESRRDEKPWVSPTLLLLLETWFTGVFCLRLEPPPLTHPTGEGEAP